jgi:PTH2 family peptidyl-tRNA hydrolase
MIKMSLEYKMVIITRLDLNLSPGKLASQVAHAAVSCALETKEKNNKWFKKWMEEGGKKAVVKVDNINDLYELKNLANKLNLATALISDAGHTEILEGTETVLGIGPAPENIIDQVTGNLPLL